MKPEYSFFMLNSPIDEIRSRLDIVDVIRSYIKLEKAGANYKALCPFHSEKNPSFFVSPARQIWHCFGCGVGGSIFDFVMKIEGLEFGDALRILAQRAGVELKPIRPELKTERQRLYEICENSAKFFETQLQESKKGKGVREYLSLRGISDSSIKKWRVGYAPDTWHGLVNFLLDKGYKEKEVERAGLAIRSRSEGNYYDRFRGRIMFPIFDWNSQVIGFGGRITEEKNQEFEDQGSKPAKYINIPQTLLYNKSKVLYGLDKSKVEIRKKDKCVLVEGYIDVIMSHQAGIGNIVASAGTALTPFHLSILKRYSENLVLAFDMDIAGDSATKRGIDLAQEKGFNIKVALMPQGMDPADVILKNPKEWQKVIKKSVPILDFYFQTTFSKFDEKKELGPDEKREISKTLLPIIKRIPNRILQSHWIQDLTNRLKVAQEDVLVELRKIESSVPEQKQEKKTASSRKSRHELLEERLFILIFKEPQTLDFVEKEDLGFFSPQASQILSFFQKYGTSKIKKLQKDISPEMINSLNYLSLKAEIEQGDEGDIFEEFKDCLREIKSLGIKKELKKISQRLKEAETERDSQKISDLTQKISELAQKLTRLD